MLPIAISVKADVSAMQRKLDDLGQKQLPFAAARGLTTTAQQVGRDVTKTLPAVFDRPTPFTMRSIGIKAARKSDLSAEVFVKDIQARYLAPSVFGERQYTPKEDVLTPAAAPLNAYGNLPRNALKRFKGRKDVFIGTVHGIYGVWQRPARGARRAGGYGTKGKHYGGSEGIGTLKLLIRLHAPVTLKRRFDWSSMVRASVARSFAPNLEKALAQAVATAR